MSAKHDVVLLISKADMVEDLERSIKHVYIYICDAWIQNQSKIRVSAGSVNAKHPLMWLCSYP